MHRTYSMRQSRAPTASQLQTPPPPSSSTKGHRLFGKSNLGKRPRPPRSGRAPMQRGDGGGPSVDHDPARTTPSPDAARMRAVRRRG